MIEQCCICRTGQVREVNQDRAGCFSTEEWCLAYVADGMGGHFAGERASEVVSRACSRWWDGFCASAQRPGFLQSVEQLRRLLYQCHDEIAGISPPDEVCGTTAVLLWISNGEYALFSVGDSRCYIISKRLGRPGTVLQLTHDDVYNAPEKPQLIGKLTRALGPGSCSFSMQTGQVQPGTAFALCSDGVYKFCPKLQQELKRLTRRGALSEAAGQIVTAVDGHGAPDNYSLVLLRV